MRLRVSLSPRARARVGGEPGEGQAWQRWLELECREVRLGACSGHRHVHAWCMVRGGEHRAVCA